MRDRLAEDEHKSVVDGIRYALVVKTVNDRCEAECELRRSLMLCISRIFKGPACASHNQRNWKATI